jgi:murein DD-endopeptidase MepM/ murein hydrolase activator NlpD
MKKVFYLVIAALLIAISSSFAQKYKAKPFFVLDTLDYNTNKIIIYSNNTWAYFKPLKDTLIKIDTSILYTKNWNNEQIFAYLGEKGISPYEYKLKFADSIGVPNMPVYGRIFGGFSGRHQGVDIELKKGQPVFAAFDGKVRYSQYNNGGYGNLVIIRHKNGLETYYGHLSKRMVAVNQEVKAGDIIGYGGSTGRSYAYHLHFETRYHDYALNPYDFINFDNEPTDSIKKYFGGYGNMYTTLNNKTISTTSSSFNNAKVGTTNIGTNKTASTYNTKYNAGVTGSNNYYNKAGVKYYTIKKGDTLYDIARRNGTSVKKICDLNKMTDKAPLKIGQSLRVN